MRLKGKKLGLLISAAPNQPAFSHALKLSETALDAGVDVYVYCIDEAVNGLHEPRLQTLRSRGLKLYGCAYAAERRDLPRGDHAIFAGLTVVNDLLTATDRFLSFN